MPDFSSGYGGGGSRTSSEDQSLLRYYRILRGRIWLILACTVLAVAAAAVYVEVAPKTYQAQAELVAQPANPADTALAELPVLRQSGDPTQDILTAASLVTTTRVAGAVVNALHLKISPTAALGDVTASPIGQASLVAVQATASSARLAQELANQFVAQTIATSTNGMHEAITAELPTLQTQLAAIPASQRYGPGSQGQLLDELKQLLLVNDPTLASAAVATLPTSPSSPKTKLTLAAGLVGGLLIGIGAAFAFHALDPRIRRVEQLRDLLGLPILAQIPRERYRSHVWPLMPAELSNASLEGYRTLRTTLTAQASSSGPHVVLVTGSAPAEGKSTSAISLAVALAQGGGRVILIEADMRKPTFAPSFGIEVQYGIQDVLIGEADLAQALIPVRVDGTSVRVLAAKQMGGELADRLSFAIVRKLIDDAKALADAVVIDSPPLTEVSDALPFAQLADETLIVVRLDHSRIHKLQELDELLARYGSAPTGLLVIGGAARDHYYYARGDGSEPPRTRRTGGRDGNSREAVRPRSGSRGA
jgi:capsular exopolysaccharide synthesis family protein